MTPFLHLKTASGQSASCYCLFNNLLLLDFSLNALDFFVTKRGVFIDEEFVPHGVSQVAWSANAAAFTHHSFHEIDGAVFLGHIVESLLDFLVS